MTTIEYRGYKLVGSDENGYTVYDPKGRYWMWGTHTIVTEHIDALLDAEDED